MTDTRPASARRRWPWLLAGGTIGTLVLAQVMTGGDAGPARGLRTAPYMLSAADLATATKSRYLRTNPPVDMTNVERAARASLGQIPLPADRDIATWRAADTGAEVTQAVLLYDDPAAAAKLDELAVRLLPGAFGLAPEAAILPGADDVRAWATAGYRALTFRRGNVAVFLGTTGDDPTPLQRLAEAVMHRPARSD